MRANVCRFGDVQYTCTLYIVHCTLTKVRLWIINNRVYEICGRVFCMSVRIAVVVLFRLKKRHAYERKSPMTCVLVTVPCYSFAFEICTVYAHCGNLYMYIWSLIMLMPMLNTTLNSQKVECATRFCMHECKQRNFNCLFLLIVRWPKMDSLFVIKVMNGDARCCKRTRWTF